MKFIIHASLLGAKEIVASYTVCTQLHNYRVMAALNIVFYLNRLLLVHAYFSLHGFSVELVLDCVARAVASMARGVAEFAFELITTTLLLQ